MTAWSDRGPPWNPCYSW